jgi:L-histidine N-alpha-methyltransferase
LSFRDDVLRGLRARPRAIPARWFYDREGSELFEAITRLPEYYPTRVEAAILERIAADPVALTGRALVEFGSGASVKTRILLRALMPPAYAPIDISGEFLRDAAAMLAAEFPDTAMLPVEADFTRPVTLPQAIAGSPKLGFFPGSTIGNLEPAGAVDLLRTMRGSLGLGALLLIGMDRVKDRDVLVRAYDDAAGVTAAFNLNLLARINRELGGDVPLDAFRHRALWNKDAGRIEMHLEATRDVAFSVAGERFAMGAGETIHTENSHKYTPESARLLLRAGGWEPGTEWTDRQDLFMVVLAEARPERASP